MNILSNYLKKYAFIIFVIITLLITLIRVPFWDETHSFEIASLSLKEIFCLLKVEGHPILWFLVMKPFANVNLYPYSMYLINWLFCISSIYILFKKAPFSYLIKTLIAFSTPFLLYYAPVARCYSIGIFFIFLLCSYHPLRFKKPYLYSTFIILASQTSVVAMIGVFYIGLIYAYEQLKRYKLHLVSKKTILIIFLMFISISLFTVLEFAHIQVDTPNTINRLFLNDLIHFILIPKGVNISSFLLRIFSFILFYSLPFYLFKYSKKGLIGITLIFFTLSYLFIFRYYARFWSYYWYYLYLIVVLWLWGRKLFKIRIFNFIIIPFFFLMALPYAVQNGTVFDYIYSSSADGIASYISSRPEYQDSKLYTLEWWSEISPGSDVYFKKKGLKIFNKNNIERGSFEDLKNIFKLKYELIDLDEFTEQAPDNYYILSDGNLLNQKFKDCFIEPMENMDIIFTTKRNKYLFKVVDNKMSNLKFIVYKVIKL